MRRPFLVNGQEGEYRLEKFFKHIRNIPVPNTCDSMEELYLIRPVVVFHFVYLVGVPKS